MDTSNEHEDLSISIVKENSDPGVEKSNWNVLEFDKNLSISVSNLNSEKKEIFHSKKMEIPVSNKESINIDIDGNYLWVSDDSVICCCNCEIIFDLMVRKHHCRYCGNIFCFNCANNFIVFPDFTTNRAISPPPTYNYWHILESWIPGIVLPERVCSHCYGYIKKTQKKLALVDNIFKNPKIINQIKELLKLNTDIEIKNICFDPVKDNVVVYY